MPTALCPGCSTSEPAPCIWPEKIVEDCAGPWTPGTPMGNLGQPSGIRSVQLWLLQSFGQRVNGWKILAISFSLKISLSSECKWLFLKKKGLCLLAPLCLKKIKKKKKKKVACNTQGWFRPSQQQAPDVPDGTQALEPSPAATQFAY